MQACARGRYGNEFGRACLGKPRLVGMSLVPVMDNLSAEAMAYRLHYEIREARRANHASSRLSRPIVACKVSKA